MSKTTDFTVEFSKRKKPFKSFAAAYNEQERIFEKRGRMSDVTMYENGKATLIRLHEVE